MPRTLEEGFRDFLTRLTPTEGESDGAKKHRASIEACLRSNFGLNGFSRIGSFGNGTSISGFSDVDYLACIPTAQLTTNSNGSLLKIRNALNDRFPGTGIGVRCPAVSVPFGGSAADNTEVVPADYIKDGNGFKIYEIADCAGGWMMASPHAHNDYVKGVNEKLGGKVKPLIRFIKAWKYLRNVPLSSFYLEMRVTKYAECETSIISDIDIKRIFRLLFDNELASMQDPLGISGYIDAAKTDAQKEDAQSKLETALTRAEKAVDVRESNLKAAFEWWNLVFADEFPSYYK